MLTVEQLRRASAFGAATVHEAAGRTGALPASIQATDESLGIAGPAFPVFVEGGENLLLHQAVYLAQPGDVLVVATSGGAEFGYWGEILAVAAQARGIAGLVIDGGVRDVARLRERRFPVFAAYRSIRGTGKTDHGVGTVGRPILIGGVVVTRGDLVVGDTDGVVVIPAADVESVIAASEERSSKEDHILARLAAGETTLDLYGFASRDLSAPERKNAAWQL